MVIDKYKKAWIFARRIRIREKVADSTQYLRHIAISDKDLGVRKFAQRQLDQLAAQSEEMKVVS